MNHLLVRFLLQGLMVFMGMVFPAALYGQSAEIILSPDSIAPGNHSRFIIQVEAPSGVYIVFPVLSDTITSEIEIISYGKPDTLVNGLNLVIRKEYIITAWQEGFFPIPPLDFSALQHGDTLLFESNAGLLEVSPVEVDLAEGIKDIRPIFRMPVGFAELLPYILGLLVLCVVIFFLVRYIRRRKSAVLPQDIWRKPDIPAHVAAISSFEKLRNQKLWQNGKIKQYHTELTWILRMYLEKRFNINAPEMTSSEIIVAMESYNDNGNVLSILQGILEQADLVKFAKHIPEDSKNESALEMAIEYVKYNIPVTDENQGGKNNGSAMLPQQDKDIESEQSKRKKAE